MPETTATEKLIRDLIPDLAAARGQSPMPVRCAAPGEMPGLLLAKLHEEVAEVAAAGPDCVLEELADVLEVVYALAAVHGCDRGDLKEIGRVKAEARGGFRDRLVWTDAPACTAALLPRGSAPVDRCVVRGPHDGHRTASGVRWTDADSGVR